MNITTNDARRALRVAAAVLALVLTCLLLTAEACYETGRLLRLAVHDRSEQLAALHLRLLHLEPTTAPSLEADPPAAPEPAAPASLVALQPEPLVIAACTSAPPAAGRTAPPLVTLTVVELRRLAQARGHRTIGGRKASKARRADLLEVLA